MTQIYAEYVMNMNSLSRGELLPGFFQKSANLKTVSVVNPYWFCENLRHLRGSIYY